MSASAIWQQCILCLQDELPSQQFNTWIRPLKVEDNIATFILAAPNRFIRDWVQDKYLVRIEELVEQFARNQFQSIAINIAEIKQEVAFSQQQSQTKLQVIENTSSIAVGSSQLTPVIIDSTSGPELNSAEQVFVEPVAEIESRTENITGTHLRAVSNEITHKTNVIANYNFDTFVEGKSNQLARAAALQVAENPGGSYNPLFLYGGVGLGKTHLMHAVGNELLKKNPNAKVLYLHSERFVADMVKALQLGAINDFKRYYRSVDALLIDDIQFFANKERSQEEFFHTFNALLEGSKQIILTSDKYPKEINNLDERLKSRFGWGLTVAVDPPELETRVAILLKKAEQSNIDLPKDAAFFIAQRLRSNVRELEGALKRVIAQSHFKNRPIDIELIKESLKDLLSLQDRLVSIDNIQKTVAEYYKIKVSDLSSKRRNRSIARPRQVAMALAKELTSHSLPEIGDAFGGRDHTTVLHACRKIEELKESNSDIREDVKNLLRILTT